MDKQVLFQPRVEIIKPVPALDPLDDPYMSSPDVELRMSQVSLQRVSSTGYSTYGLLHSTPRGATNYNYGYATDDHQCNRQELPSAWRRIWRRSASGHGGLWERLHEQEQRWWTRGCYACIVLLSLLTIATLVTILIWCIVVPKRPGMEVRNGSAHIRLERESAARWASFSFELMVRNPNKVVAEYSRFSFDSRYRDTRVGEANITGFSQQEHATDRHKVQLWISRNLMRDANASDSFSLQIDGRVHARLRILGRSTPSMKIRLSCIFDIKLSQQKVIDQRCQLKKHRVFAIG